MTHVALAFMNSATFNAAGAPGPDRWPRMFATVAETRSKFAPGTKVMIAIGGWGDTEGFEVAARDGESRSRWAGNVAAMVRDTGADGGWTWRWRARWFALARLTMCRVQGSTSTGSTLGKL